MDKISPDIVYQPLGTLHPAVPSHAIRNDIQSLRALAIIFVLLFHMWPSHVQFGYLGVDMFFVISGYLICMILSKKRPLKLNQIAIFYFRRIKRIVPIYLFIAFIVLLAIYYLISPIEFIQIVKEAIPALGFYSNFPSTRSTKYFDISSKFSFFLHTWSLSVEMQFYLTIPILFFLFEFVDKLRTAIKFTLIGLIPTASFLYQICNQGDAAHMLLISRFWQFFAGFAAYYVYENRLFDVFGVNHNLKDKWRLNADNALILFLCSILGSCFVFGSASHSHVNRIVVIIATTIIIGHNNENFGPLSNKFIVLIGDSSYSIYLIHWPIFTWERYSNMSYYSAGNEANYSTGYLLIAVSIIMGYLIEKSFKFILKHIDGSVLLLGFLLLFGYCANSMLLYELKNNAINLNELGPDEMPKDWQKKIREDVIMLWNQRHSMPNYTNDQIMTFNSEFIHAYHTMSFCDNKSPILPTRFPINMSSYDPATTFTCHNKGTGDKNIVLIGNSHIFHNFPGIQYEFKEKYKKLTLFARNSCLPTSRKFQQPGLSEKVKDECIRLLNETVLALQQWTEPIHLIIAFYALVDRPDVPLPIDMKTDEFFNSMQNFYFELNSIPTEALILMESFPVFSDNAISVVSSRMKAGKPLDDIGDLKSTLVTRYQTLRRRSEMLECEKCIKLKFIDFWCGKNESFCHSAQKQGLIYFADWHHPSAYGSFFNAEHMRGLFEDFVEKRKIGT